MKHSSRNWLLFVFCLFAPLFVSESRGSDLDVKWFSRLHQNMLECTHDLIPESLMLSYQIVAAEVKIREPYAYYSAIKDAGTSLTTGAKWVYNCTGKRKFLSASESRRKSLDVYYRHLEEVVTAYGIDSQVLENVDLEQESVDYYQFNYLNQSLLVSRAK